MSKQAFKRVRTALKMERTREPLPTWAWPGGYPLFYLCSDGECLCPDCVNSGITQIDQSIRERLSDGWHVIGYDVHWQGIPVVCVHCGKAIEAAYGEDGAEQSE